MTAIVHVIQRFSSGGAAASLMTLAAASTASGRFDHAIVSLRPADPQWTERASRSGIAVHCAPAAERLQRLLAEAEIVQVHFWNTPELYAFLRSDLPPMRLLLRVAIGGLHPPHVLTPELVQFADHVLTASPFTRRLPVLRDAPTERASMLVSLVDPSRLARVAPQAHRTFNVGYVGAVAFTKMHPDFVSLCAQVRAPDAHFIVCGHPTVGRLLREQAAALGLAGRLELRGQVQDVAAALAEMDVFGYPLCRDNYSASERALQEAMLAGVPPVVLPYGGAAALVRHNETGLIVDSEDGYGCAIERLHDRPDERRRLGENARAYAAANFGLERGLEQFHRLCEQMRRQPKRSRRLDGWDAASGGAQLFAASLGAAPHFQASLSSHDDEALLEAECTIATSSPVLCSDTGGGILHYRNAYPRDPHLRLWSGLALLGQGQHVRALAELQVAHELGIQHWRVHWHMAQAAQGLAAAQPAAARLLAAHLQQVLRVAPDFAPAQRLAAERVRP